MMSYTMRFSVMLAWCVLVVAIGAGQESVASRPASKLPASDQAVPFDEKGAIEVKVIRAPRLVVTTSRSRSLFEDWCAGILLTPYRFDKNGMALLTSAIDGLGRRRHAQRNVVERILGSRKLCPPTPEGDRLLEKHLKADHERFEKAGKADVPLIIDSGPHVPWQDVVDILTMARRLGIKSVQFGWGSAPEEK